MPVTVKLHSLIGPPELAKKSPVLVPYRDHLTIGEILEQLDIRCNVVGVVLFNGLLITNMEYTVSDEGTLELYPVFGGG